MSQLYLHTRTESAAGSRAAPHKVKSQLVEVDADFSAATLSRVLTGQLRRLQPSHTQQSSCLTCSEGAWHTADPMVDPPLRARCTRLTQWSTHRTVDCLDSRHLTTWWVDHVRKTCATKYYTTPVQRPFFRDYPGEPVPER